MSQHAEIAVLRQGCIGAITGAGEHAPEVSPGDADALRVDLLALSRALSPAVSVEESQRVQTGVCRALQGYQRQTHSRRDEMHRQLAVVQTAMRDFTAGVSSHHAAHHGTIEEELEALHIAAQGSDLGRIRDALRGACAGIRLSCAEFSQAQRLVTLQLLDEIRVLRETVDAHRNERRRDSESGLWPRERIDQEIRARLARQEPLSILLISIYNLRELQAEEVPATILSLFEALTRRLTAILGREAMVGRWGPISFAVLLDSAGPGADAIRDRMCAHLPASFFIQTSGLSRHLRLDLSISLLDPAAAK
jgi:GGDEF domain-containing protein